MPNSSVGNITYPFGTKILLPNLTVDYNSMNITNIDNSLNNLFIGRNNFSNIIKRLVAGGNNAAPSGTYQQPSGFTHNLTEGEIDTLSATWSVKEKIWILVNCQVSSVDTTKRYKWTITTN